MNEPLTNLLTDIQNYKKTKHKLFNIFNIINNLYEEPELIHQLIYDWIDLFMESKSVCGKPHFFYIVLRRHIFLHSRSDTFIKNYISRLPVNVLINIYWGLFTISERNNIISNSIMHLEIIYRSIN